jgi:hypothetical protein
MLPNDNVTIETIVAANQSPAVSGPPNFESDVQLSPSK